MGDDEEEKKEEDDEIEVESMSKVITHQRIDFNPKESQIGSEMHIGDDDLVTERDFRSDSISGINPLEVQKQIENYQDEKQKINEQLQSLRESLANNDPQIIEKLESLLAMTSKPQNIATNLQIEQIVEEGEDVVKRRLEFEK